MPAADLSTPLAWASRYAELGWHVLPLEPNSKQPVGKLVPRGMLDATVDLQVIRSWWMRAPKANVGIALAQSGLVAIDVDPRNGGNETFEQLQAEHGSLRSEVMAFTGGGGEHHVFLVPPGSQISLPGTLGAGVDLKANGYIVVEPSIHPSGKQYGWEASSNPLDGVVPSPLPDWLRSLRVRLETPKPAVSSVPMDPARARDAREALYVLDSDDYHQWVQAGMALHSTGWGQGAYAMWCSWAQQSDKFDATESRKKWDSFKADRADGITLAWVFGEAQRRGWANPAARLRGHHESEPPFVDASGEMAAHPRGSLPLIFSEDIQQSDVSIRQIVEDVLTAGGLSVMYGESNSGKSFLACAMSCAIGAGVEWLGKRTVRGAVLYVAGEGAESIKLRVLAWRQHHELEPLLAIVPVAVNLLDSSEDMTRVIAAAEATAEHYKEPVSLIVIDTLARAMAGGNENASEDMGAVISSADKLRAATGASVMFVHHSGKDSAKGGRGHSSLKAATDTEIEVTADEESKTHTATITKQRDLASRGSAMSGRFFVIEMGRDQWDKPITTCIVEPTETPKVANRAKGSDLRRAMVALLSAAPGRSMVRSKMVKTLEEAGFTKSPIYRTWGELVAAGEAEESGQFAHLLITPKDSR